MTKKLTWVPQPWPTDGNLSATYGQLGDYVGGFWGTIVASIALVVVFFTWWTTKKNDNGNSILTILSEMLVTHDRIIQQHIGFQTVLLQEFSSIYRVIGKFEPDYNVLSVRDRLNISYIYCLYGVCSGARHALKLYNAKTIKLIHDYLAKRRDRHASREIQWYRGRQIYLPHYMRNLFSAYRLIDDSGMSMRDRLRAAKVIKSKLSNFDQAILAINVLSDLGESWESEGLINLYKPISNIPETFFGVDGQIRLEDLFPMVDFEWRRKRNDRTRYRYKEIGALNIVWFRQYPVS